MAALYLSHYEVKARGCRKNISKNGIQNIALLFRDKLNSSHVSCASLGDSMGDASGGR